MLKVTIDNRDGTLWDIAEVTNSIKYKTDRVGKASSVDMSFIRNSPITDKRFKYAPGDVIRIIVDGVNLFFGYIFTIDESHDDVVKITAYDQMRYLMGADTYVFTKTTATAIITKIISDMQLKAGTIANTSHVIPKMSEDGQVLMDIICRALDHTLIATQQLYVFYDDFGKLTLTNATSMLLDVVLGDESLVYGYNHKRSIDSDTYNHIKIVRSNEKSGKRDVYIYKDSSTIAKWGRLQLFQEVDKDMNEAQIKRIGENLIALKNREIRSFKLDALGDVRVRAGTWITVQLKALGVNGRYLVDSCTHSFEGDEHTMSLELRVYG